MDKLNLLTNGAWWVDVSAINKQNHINRLDLLLSKDQKKQALVKMSEKQEKYMWNNC